MKPSDPLLLADVPLRFGMWPAVKVDFSKNLAIPGLPQIHQTVGKPSLVKHSRPSDLKSASNVSLPLASIKGPHKWTQLSLFHKDMLYLIYINERLIVNKVKS